MASTNQVAPWMQNWQSAYPYITNKSTGIKLGDYEDAMRKFYKAYAGANPAPALNWNKYDAQKIEQGYTPTAEDYAQDAAYSDWESGQNQAFFGQLTPQQQEEYFAQKHNKYKSQQRMGQMAFLAAAGGMAMPGLLGAMGTMGGTGATSAAAAAGGDLGMAGWMGAGTGPMGVEAGAAGLAGSGAGGSLAGSGGSMWNSIPDFLKSLGTSTAKNVGGNWLSQLIGAGTNAYMGNKQAGQYNDVINQINQLYSPDSAYAKQMQQSLARKDAAAGRNSQYGSRAVELAAALTQAKSNALTSPGYGNLMGQRGINQNVPWNGFLAAMGSRAGQDLITKAGGGFGSWLSGLFGNSGDRYSPTAPNASSSPNWWNQLYSDGGP